MLSPKIQVNVLYPADLITSLDKLNDNRYYRTELLAHALEEYLEKRVGKGDDVDLF